MIRIAIATLAITMIGGPMIAMGAAPRQEPEPQAASEVSQDNVVALAKAQGLARLSDISYEQGVWTVRGATRDGRPVQVAVSGAGEVLKPIY